MNTLTRTKQPKVYMHNTKLVLSRSERISHDKAVEYYIAAGYPLEQAKKRADDHLMIDRQVKNGTFRSKW